jgi:hypothetical protein
VYLHVYYSHTSSTTLWGFPQLFHLTCTGGSLRWDCNLNKTFPAPQSETAKESRKGSLPGLPFHFAARLYCMHGLTCGRNAITCGNVAFPVQRTGKVTAARMVQRKCGMIFEAMKTDKGQFDEVLRRMLQKSPQKTSAIHANKQPKTEPKPTQDQKSDQ